MVIKMFAVGIIIVVASVVDMFLSNVVLSKDSEVSGSVITALRGFRLLRVFKLAQQWKRFELLLETLARTLRDIATFSILLFIIILVFTLLGLELFAFKVKLNKKDIVDYVNGESPDFNFDTFFNSFSTVFISLT